MKNQNVKNDNKKTGCGKCIFCLSQCPECGSRNVSVRYQPEIEYDYSEGDNNISISINEERLEITCEDCGDFFETDSFSNEYSPLVEAIQETINLSDHMSAERKKNGKIELKHYTYEKV
jgi:Zn finger protein HypA/HybF involved in hydrogenase expression